jgi:chemotaxis protein MotB
MLLLALLATSCVSKKKFMELNGRYDEMKVAYDKLQDNCDRNISKLERDLYDMQGNIQSAQLQLDNERGKVANLQQEVHYLKSTNTNLLDRLSDLSVISKTGADNIKKSLEALDKQNQYIKDLTGTIQTKDSLNLALVVNLKRSLANINDEDVTIEVKKGVVYISISDKMLFKSGSYEITARAEEVLGKIARIINDHDQLEVLVEGHTDTVPIKTDCMKDNWDLSALRATAVVRVLQKSYAVDPARLTAGGRSEYIPKATNATAKGKSLNRRTEIILLPKLDEFFELLEPPTEGI